MPRLWCPKSSLWCESMAHNKYSYAPFIAKSKAACGLPWIMRKYDVIQTLPEEDRATAMGNMHKN